MTVERIAAAIPALDAAPSIAVVIERTLPLVAEVLVVDDGSRDATAETARRAGARVLSHPQNLGKGRALATAFRDLFAGGATAVVTLDADGQHLPAEIPKLLTPYRAGADLVIGTRTHLFAQMHLVRRTSNRVSSWLISRCAGRPLPDVQSGFRLYTRELLDRTGFPEARFEAESAVVVRAFRAGLAVVWVPIDLGFADGRITSHYRPLADSLRIASAVVRARFTS